MLLTEPGPLRLCPRCGSGREGPRDKSSRCPQEALTVPAPGPTGHVPTGEGAGRAAPRGPPGPDHKTHTALRCHRSHPPQPCHTPARRRAGTRGPSSLVPEGLRPGGRSCLLPETGGSTASPSCKQEVITELGGLLVWGLQAHSDLLSSDQTPHPPGGGPRPLSITPLPRPPSPGGTCHCRRPPLPRPLVGHICRLRSLPAGWGRGERHRGLAGRTQSLDPHPQPRDVEEPPTAPAHGASQNGQGACLWLTGLLGGPSLLPGRARLTQLWLCGVPRGAVLPPSRPGV